MTFLHVSLLLGTVAALAPIVMHMLGARQPKTLMFPAVRFVRKTAITAQRGWNVKRWLLLLLRMLLVMVLAFALASPRVHSNMLASYLLIGLVLVLALLASAAAAVAFGAKRSSYLTGTVIAIAVGLWGLAGFWTHAALSNSQPIPLADSSGPICAAIVIDTSPTMGYRFHNATRLDEAKTMAKWLMDRLPIGSQIAIVGSDAGVRLNPDRLSADRQLDRVLVEGRATNLVSRISTSVDMLRRSELQRREIYVLSDLRSRPWAISGQSDLATKLKENTESSDANSRVLVQLIDLSVPADEIKDWSIDNWKLNQDSTVPGGQVTLTADVRSLMRSGSEQLMCELAIEPIDTRLPTTQGGQVVVPTSKVVDHQLVLVPDGGSAPVRMSLKDLAEGTNHAELRIVRSDPLEIDNVIYLSIEARSQGQTAVLADDARDAQVISLMIEPNIAMTKNQADSAKEDAAPTVSSAPTTESIDRISKMDLAKFSNVVLFNPSRLDADDADRLLQWVDGGGGLMLVLGPGFKSAESLMESDVHRLIPGQVRRQSRRELNDNSTFLNPVLTNHPIWSIFERNVNEIPWINYPVFRHWDIENLQPEVAELMRFTDSDLPAIMEWSRGQGRVIITALPYPEPTATALNQPWSELYTTSSDAWPGFALFFGTVRYLATQGKHSTNYFVESTAVLENNTTIHPKTYELYNPAGEVVRVHSAEELVTYSFTKMPGQYRLRGLRPRGPVVRGFSVNVDRKEIELDRVSQSALDSAMGSGNYLIAKDRNDVQSSLGEGRHGRDLTPFLLMFVVMMVLAEQTMASRFYASTSRGKS